MISPAFGPVEGSTVEVAAVNIQAFAAEVTERAAVEGEKRGSTPRVGEPVRDESLDDGGRFGWILSVDCVDVPVLMPGIDLGVLKELGDDVPALKVSGEWSWWSGAVMLAVPVPGP